MVFRCVSIFDFNILKFHTDTQLYRPMTFKEHFPTFMQLPYVIQYLLFVCRGRQFVC